MSKKRYAIILLFVIFFLSQFAFIYNDLENNYSKSSAIQPIGEIVKGTEIKFKFQSKYENMNSIGIMFATYNRKNYGDILAEIYDENNTIIHSEIINVSKLKDNSYKKNKVLKS